MQALSTKDNKSLKIIFPKVIAHQKNLINLNRWWDKVALVGKINSLNVPQSLLANMLDTKTEFAELQELLIENLLAEQIQQIGRKHRTIAQTLIDIPNRNLFERTADVGFLATDSRIVSFLSAGEHDARDDQSMQQHLLEYAAKYSVYDDVMLFDSNGRLLVRMNSVVSGQMGADPAIEQALQGKDDYIEVCRYSTLCPHKPLSSLFLAPVKDPLNGRVIGVLCLSFKLADEMASLIADLSDDSDLLMALLDSHGYVLESSNESTLNRGCQIKATQSQQLITLNNQQYICTTAPARGYQGYMGLGWQGCVLMPFSHSTDQPNSAEQQVSAQDAQRWLGFSATLSAIQRRARIVTDDLDLVVLNGRIAAARSDADEFIPILEEIRQIGRKMQGIFSSSVSQLMMTALTTHFNALSAQAALAIDIMDRNLYERANDCRWWALTERFSQALSSSDIDANATDEMQAILTCINELYTVYTGIYVYDKNGTVQAVSSPSLDSHRHTTAPEQSRWRSVLSLADSQQYCVSSFQHTALYQHRPTYIYNAAIRNHKRVVGGIGMVFDSEVEFRQMLDDVLNTSPAGRLGVYVDRSGLVISASANAPWQAGEQLDLPGEILTHERGSQGAGIYMLDQQEHVIGFAVSKGYREYKTEDGYRNDVIALMVEQNRPVS